MQNSCIINVMSIKLGIQVGIIAEYITNSVTVRFYTVTVIFLKVTNRVVDEKVFKIADIYDKWNR